MKYFVTISFFILSLFSSICLAELEPGKWNFVLDEDYCYIGSFPTLKDVPEGKTRGDAYIIVYRINKNPDAVIQINAGYPYNEDKAVKVVIDKTTYEFFSQDDSAWTKKDKEIIYAMKRGIILKVIGISSRGTQTEDTYTLKGFTAAYEKLSKGC